MLKIRHLRAEVKMKVGLAKAVTFFQRNVELVANLSRVQTDIIV